MNSRRRRQQRPGRGAHGGNLRDGAPPEHGSRDTNVYLRAPQLHCVSQAPGSRFPRPSATRAGVNKVNSRRRRQQCPGRGHCCRSNSERERAIGSREGSSPTSREARECPLPSLTYWLPRPRPILGAPLSRSGMHRVGSARCGAASIQRATQPEELQAPFLPGFHNHSIHPYRAEGAYSVVVRARPGRKTLTKLKRDSTATTSGSASQIPGFLLPWGFTLSSPVEAQVRRSALATTISPGRGN